MINFIDFRWVWNSGGTVNGSDALWAPGEPNDHHGEDCAGLYRDDNYLMNDFDCTVTQGGICQLPPE